MDLGLLELDDLATRVSEIVQFSVQCIRDRKNTILNRLVVLVLNSERDQLRPDSAEFDRPLCHALRDLPHGGILQIASRNWPVDAGHDARFEIVMQNVAWWKRKTALARRRRLRVAIEATHVPRRGSCSTLAPRTRIKKFLAGFRGQSSAKQ